MKGCILLNPHPLTWEKARAPNFAAIALTPIVNVAFREGAMTLPPTLSIAAERYAFFTAMLERFRP